MKRIFGLTAMPVIVTAFAVAFIALSAPAAGRADDSALAAPKAMASPATDRTTALRDGMRRLWEDHVTWTRLAVISLTTDSPDTKATVGRLLKNQTDIGNAIKPFYGDEAGTKLTGLLSKPDLTA